MKISKLQSIFSKYFKDNMQVSWVISEIQKLPEKDKQSRIYHKERT